VPENLFSFIIYIIWAVILSIPFHYLNPSSVNDYIKNAFKLYGKKQNISIEKVKIAYEKSNDKDFEDYEVYENEMLLGFVLIKTILACVLYKFIIYFKILNYSVLDISLNYLHLIIVLTATTIISFPVGNLYSKIFLKLIYKHFDKEF